MKEEKTETKPVKFRFYGNCKTTGRLREVTIVRPSSDQYDLSAAFEEARLDLLKPKMIVHP